MTHSAGWTGRSPAIARVNNAGAGRWEDTDWEQIVLLYDMPLHLEPSPVTRLHRAIAVRYAAGDAGRYAEASSTEKALVQARSASAARMVRPTGNASSGAMTLSRTRSHKGLDEVRPVARSRSRHASSPGARHSKWPGKARLS